MTDEELMLAVCNSDESAYQALVKKHLQAISHYAYRLLGNSKDTEEITQETFLRLWLNSAHWQPAKANLSTWLHRIAHNLCIDYLRKHRRVTASADPQLEAGLADAHAEAQATNTIAGIDASVAARHLHGALQELPESQRSALMLCHYQGFSNKEAAAIMDISVKALESAIARAKRALRQRLSELNTAELAQPDTIKREQG